MFSNEDYQSILHEIKNSICLIGSSLQMIEKQHPEVQDFRYWNDTMTDISNLTNMFLEISAARLHTSIQKKTISSAEFFAEIQGTILSMLPERIQGLFEIQPDLPEIDLDPLRIRHAVINLVKNAIEAMDSTGFIKVSVFIQAESLCIQVQDNGCGIEEDKIDKIFSPIYTSKPNGTGLGLSITKQIIEAHQGTIHCQSRPKEGTTFTILLPIR